MQDPLTPGEQGTLFPDRLPANFRRLPAEASARDLVMWWWISEWDLPEGEQSVQHLLGFTTSNLVVENSVVGFAGPTTRASTTTLTGRGWAVAALLQPAAVPEFTDTPSSLRDRYILIDAPELHELIIRSGTQNLDHTIPSFTAWLTERVGPINEEGRLANRLVHAAMTDPEIITLATLAAAVGVSQRTLHRLAARYVGISPYAMIRRRRLQEAAAHIRRNPHESLAGVAARFAFTDQAHLAREFRTTLGHPPASYRRQL